MLSDQREDRRHSTALRPFSYYPSRIPEYFPHVPVHCHPELELDMMVDGEAFFMRRGEQVCCRSGDVLLFLPDELHAVYPAEGRRAVYDTLVFSRTMLGTDARDRAAEEVCRPFVAGAWRFPFPLREDAPFYGEIRAAAESVMAAAREDSPMADLTVRSGLLRLIPLLCAGGTRVNCPANGQSAVIRQIVSYISDHQEEPLTVASIAEEAHLSPSHMSHLFRQATGVSVMAYLIQIRLRRAREMLTDTDLGIAEIAMASGFRNLSNFNRLFRNLSGCSPREYRTRRKEAPPGTSERGGI